jgi:hypothetical protein
VALHEQSSAFLQLAYCVAVSEVHAFDFPFLQQAIV